MMLTDLADAARTSGLAVVEVAGWRTRGVLDRKGRVQQMAEILGVTCHHTAGALTGNAPSLTVVRDGRANLAGPLAHILLARDGTVYIVAAGLCNHAGISLKTSYENRFRIGIEAEFHPAQGAWPQVQVAAYVALCAALARWYRVPISEVLGHKETCSPVGRKIDPAGIDMAVFRRQVATRLAPTITPPSDDLEGPMKVQFTDAYAYSKARRAGKSEAAARAEALVTYNSAEAALAGLGSFLSALLRDVQDLKEASKK